MAKNGSVPAAPTPESSGALNPLLENAIPEASARTTSPLAMLSATREGLDHQRSLLELLQRMPQLTCLDGPARGSSLWIELPLVRIGRGINCHLVIEDPSVAPIHALLTRLPGGTYYLSSTQPDEAPVLVRRRGMFRPMPALHLQDGMVIRLGKRGPRLRFRFLGQPDETSLLTRLLLALRNDEPLLPEPVLRERLGEVWRTANLQPMERHTLQQALRFLRPYRFYRRWTYLWLLIALLLALGGLSRQLLLNDVRKELATVQRQLASLWQGQSPASTAAGIKPPSTGATLLTGSSTASGVPSGAPAGTASTGATRIQATAGEGETAQNLSENDEQTLLSGDPEAQQVLRLMRTAGMAQPTLSLGMMSQIHSEIEKEVQRIKHRFEIEAFQARAQKYQPRIEDIFRREFQLPPMLATLAWLESDFRLDAENSNGGLGMWQLSEAVATQYGLITDQGEDFRMDFEASTRGTARYLTDLLTHFGMEQLPLVIAAFHLGPEVVENTLRKHQLWRLEQRTFPYLLRLAGTGDADTLTQEQLQYVSRFFAVQIIAANQGYYLR